MPKYLVNTPLRGQDPNPKNHGKVTVPGTVLDGLVDEAEAPSLIASGAISVVPEPEPEAAEAVDDKAKKAAKK